MPNLLLLLFTAVLSGSHHSPSISLFPGKTITVIVNANGQAIMGRDTLSMEEMTKELKTRLWKGYLGTGKMADSISLQFANDALMGVRQSATDAVKKAQADALTDLCLEKFKTTFDQLNTNRQDKLRRQFPVLFQQTF
jgi:hypothetical protein